MAYFLTAGNWNSPERPEQAVSDLNYFLEDKDLPIHNRGILPGGG